MIDPWKLDAVILLQELEALNGPGPVGCIRFSRVRHNGFFNTLFPAIRFRSPAEGTEAPVTVGMNRVLHKAPTTTHGTHDRLEVLALQSHEYYSIPILLSGFPCSADSGA
jgi:hypothetical protein